jgi:hypothetical protein
MVAESLELLELLLLLELLPVLPGPVMGWAVFELLVLSFNKLITDAMDAMVSSLVALFRA